MACSCCQSYVPAGMVRFVYREADVEVLVAVRNRRTDALGTGVRVMGWLREQALRTHARTCPTREPPARLP